MWGSSDACQLGLHVDVELLEGVCTPCLSAPLPRARRLAADMLGLYKYTPFGFPPGLDDDAENIHCCCFWYCVIATLHNIQYAHKYSQCHICYTYKKYNALCEHIHCCI